VYDLSHAAIALTTVVESVRDDQLGLPTPCEHATVGALLAHVDGLSRVFTAAAREDRPAGGDTAPGPGDDDVTPGWRDRIPDQLADLAKAWAETSAWQGMTRAGGVDLPRDLAGLVVTDELIVHGWDLAAATGQAFDADPALVQAALQFVGPSVAQAPGGTPGLFGPPVAAPDDARPLERLLGLTGRDPAWRPSARRAGG
jgi:uncharacterized protein (TIGR03086 family)